MENTGDEHGCLAAEIKQHLIDLKEEIRAIKVNQTEGIFDVKQQLAKLTEEIRTMKVKQTEERVFGGGRCFKVSPSISLWHPYCNVRMITVWNVRNRSNKLLLLLLLLLLLFIVIHLSEFITRHQQKLQVHFNNLTLEVNKKQLKVAS